MVKKVFTAEKIYVRDSRIVNAGRGVYAKSEIRKGEIIERCPVIEISGDDTANLRESVLVTYFFYWGKNKSKAMLALGFGAIYNHADKANAKYKIKPKERVMEFVALEDIKKDEEIVINYRGDSKTEDPLWFEID